MLWDPLFDRISEITGSPADQCKLIGALLVSFPLASIWVRIPASRPNWSHATSLVIAAFFLGPLLRLWGGILHLLGSSVVVYGVVASVRGRQMPWIVFFIAMGHLTFIHVGRAMGSVPVETVEISASQMVLVMKLTTFAWNVHDGRQSIDTLDDSQRATRLSGLPNPLAYLAYCFFFPTVLVGPSFDYASYDALISHTIYNAPIPGQSGEAAATKRTRRPKGRRRVAYLHFVIGLIFLGFYAVMGTKGSYERVNSDEWPTWSLLTRFGFVQFCGFVARTKYYAVWSLSEGACILTGLGFNGYDPKTGRTLWNRVRNINILAIESAESFKVLFDSWNCRTNVWLRDCVYKRLAKKGKKPGPVQSMATFVTSAFWHGIAPGYYLAFVTAGLLQYLGKQLRHLVRPYFLPANSPGAANSLPRWPYPNLAKRCYDIAGWFMVQINLNYLVAAFLLLQFKASVMAWARMYFYGHVIIFTFMAFLRLGGKKWLRAGLPPRTKDKPAVSAPVPSFTLSPPTPLDERENPDGDDDDLEWVKHDLNSMGEDDGGMMTEMWSGMDTRPGTPKIKDL